MNSDSGRRDNVGKVQRRFCVPSTFSRLSDIGSIRQLSGKEVWKENMIKMPVFEY